MVPLASMSQVSATAGMTSPEGLLTVRPSYRSLSTSKENASSARCGSSEPGWPPNPRRSTRGSAPSRCSPTGARGSQAADKTAARPTSSSVAKRSRRAGKRNLDRYNKYAPHSNEGGGASLRHLQQQSVMKASPQVDCRTDQCLMERRRGRRLGPYLLGR